MKNEKAVLSAVETLADIVTSRRQMHENRHNVEFFTEELKTLRRHNKKNPIIKALYRAALKDTDNAT